MGLHIPFDRPLAELFADRVTARRRARRPHAVSPYAPPAAGGTLSSLERRVDDARVAEVVTLVTRAMLSESGNSAGLIADIEAVVSPEVVVWSPTIHARSRAELIEALLNSDDALTDVNITIGAVDILSPTAYVEWRLEGRFSNPFFVDDDVLVEPTGRIVNSAGIVVVRLVADRAAEVRCYYDDLALLEQVLTSP